MSHFWFSKAALDPTASLERVLLIHPFGIGDALFITPVIRALKESGVNQIDLLLGSRTRDIFETNPHVHQIFEWDKSLVTGFSMKWGRFKRLVALFLKLWRNRYQVCVDFSPRAQYAFLAWAIFWIPIRIGFNFKRRGFFLTHKKDLRQGFSRKPVLEYYCDLLHFLNIQVSNRRTEFFLTDENHENGNVILRKLGLDNDRPYLIVVPGGGESWGPDARLKRWPVVYFGKLIRSLYQDRRSVFEKVLILGGRKEHSLGTELLQELGGVSAHNLCGSTSIRTAGALIEKAAFLLANDGGLVHLAHALHTPLIALYGPVDPQVYGPYPLTSEALVITNEGPACRPCYQQFRYQASCVGVECLAALSVERVLEKIRSSRFLERLQPNLVSR
ncbi:MAG: glycosyltransferase family 9 protein [Candidatus Omnitrophica bacterium]|nr:glycosyltransferase family 9 protein [Candidatus Omnitrophota bacterium]